MELTMGKYNPGIIIARLDKIFFIQVGRLFYVQNDVNPDKIISLGGGFLWILKAGSGERR